MEEKGEQLRLHWDLVEKQFLVHVSIDGLMAFLSSSKSALANEVISEALSFAQFNGGDWKFYACFHCNQKYIYPELHFEHLKRAHLEAEDISTFYSSLLPVRVSSEWESMILSGTWKPIDISASLAMFQEQLELQRCNSPPLNVLGMGFLEHLEKEYQIEMGASEYFSTRSLPLSDDLERESMLMVIRNLLQTIFFNGTLTKSHVNKLIRYCMKELEHFFPSLESWLRGSNQMHMCICFLETSQLQNVVIFLQQMSNFPESPILDEVSSKHSALAHCPIGFSSKEKIVLNGNSLCIFFDEQLFGVESSSHNVIYDDDCQDRRSMNDALLRWSSACHSNEEHVRLWTLLGEQRNNHGKYLLQALEKNFETLQNLLNNKSDRLEYNRELRLIFFGYIGELSSRVLGRHVSQSFETLLQNKKNVWSDCHSAKAASNILEEAQARVLKKTLIGPATEFFYLERVFKMYSTVETEADSYIHEAFNRVSGNNDLELMKNDARIMQALAETLSLELMINSLAVTDYTVILLPFVKLYIQSLQGHRLQRV